ALAIGAQRDLVVDAGRHVAKVRGRNIRAGDRLEIEDIDRLLGALDEVIGIERSPDDRVRELCCRAFPGEGRKPAAGEQWTAGEKLQKATAAGGSIKRGHD